MKKRVGEVRRVNNMSIWTVNPCLNPPILSKSSIIIFGQENDLLILQHEGIWKYHVDHHAWNKLITYPSNFRFSKSNNAIYDEETNCIYTYRGTKLWQIDLNSKDNTFNKLHDFSEDLRMLIQGISYAPLMFMHKNEIHVIGKNRRKEHSQFHIILNETTKMSEYRYKYYSTNYTLSKYGVFMKQRNSYITIGRNNVDFCILEYSFSNNQWINWEIEGLTQIQGPIVRTETEDYVICIDMKLQNICVIDVNQRKCRKGAVQLPQTLACLDGLVLSSHHLNDMSLVFGYINEIWNHKEYSNIPLLPWYLIRFISNWLYSERLHLIGRNWYSNKAHYWTIDIDQILVDSP